MSKTIKGSKAVGYDYWSKRPCSKRGYGPHIKDMTHRRERMDEKELLLKEKKEFYCSDS